MGNFIQSWARTGPLPPSPQGHSATHRDSHSSGAPALSSRTPSAPVTLHSIALSISFSGLLTPLFWPTLLLPATLVAQRVKRLPTMRETRVRSLGQEDLLEKAMATHSSTLALKSQGWRSLVGYSPRGHKESDTTERLHHHHQEFKSELTFV